MIRALIVDDETKLREVMKMKITKYCTEVTIVGEASNAKEAKDQIEKLDPQVVFLDVAMPGDSGFDLLKSIPTINFEVVFVTGYGQFGLEAVKASAVDYLMKPVKTTELISAIEKVKRKIENKDKASRYDVLKHNITNLGNQETQIAIPGSDAYDFIKVSDILRCEGWNKYTKVYTSEGRVIISSYNIGVFKKLLEPYSFFYSHKSHLVNQTHIKKYLKEGILIMSDDAEVPLARRRREEFAAEVLSISITLN